MRLQHIAPLLLLLAAAATLQAQLCTTTTKAVPVRAEGKTELVADVIVTCTGGSPGPPNQTIPAYNITLTFNSNVTSRILGATGASEALLLLDEPAPGAQYPCDQPSGICTAYGNGTGSGYYGGGQPTPITPNNRNVFQGFVAYPTPSPGGPVSDPQSVTWLSIPYDSPGNGTRTFRFTNLRLDATASKGTPQLVGLATAAPVQFLTSLPLAVASAQPSMTDSVRDAADANAAPGGVSTVVNPGGSSLTRYATLRFASLYSGADRTRTVAPPNGLDTSPAPVNQNTPGSVYNSESGFFNSSFGTYGSGGNLGTAGLADEGTRYMAVFSNIPPGAALFVDVYNAGATTGGPAARLIAAGANGAKPFTAFAGGTTAQLPVNGTSTVAVWEVLKNNPVSADQFDFGVYLAYPPGFAYVPAPIVVQMQYAAVTPAASIPVFATGTGPQTLLSFQPPPNLIADPPALNLTATVGSQSPPAAPLTVSSSFSAVPLTFFVSSTGTLPLRFTPGSGTTPATITVSLLTTQGLTAGTHTDTITVRSSGGNSTTTVPVTLTLTPAPQIQSISPSNVTAGGAAFTLTVNGANFTRGTNVQWNGSALPTVVVSSTQLTAQVAASLIAAPATVSITAASPDVSISNAVTLAVGRLSISSLSPASVTAGSGTFVLTIAGSGFLPGATVNAGGSSLQPQTLTATQITVAIPAAAIAQSGTLAIAVVNPDGVTSNRVTLSISPQPRLDTVAPTSITATAPAFLLTATGSGFQTGATVQIGGSTLQPSALSATQITTTVTADLIAQPGALPVTIVNPGNVASNAVVLTVNPAPVADHLVPPAATAGVGGLSVVLAGSNFPSGAVVQWNGQALPTTVDGPSQATVQVSPALTAAAGTATITVLTGDGVSSNGLTFTINPAPRISALGPSSAVPGAAAFTLTVTGTNFASGAVVRWNSQALGTTFVNPAQLTAQVPASLVATAGTASLTVVTADGVASNALVFTIALPPIPGVNINAPNAAPSGQDQTVTLNLAGTYPVDLLGTLTLTFTGDGGPPDDPAIQFQNGSRVFTFTLPAGTSPQPVQVVMKTGTVAGVATIATSFTAGGTDVTPSGIGPQRIQIPRAAPSLSTPTCTRNSTGFTVVIDGFTNTREATSAIFDFQAAAGANLGTNEITVPTTSLFGGWFGSSGAAGAGGLFRYTQPFTVQGNTSGITSISARLANSAGTSAAVSCQLP
jgi:hypothetical protein